MSEQLKKEEPVGTTTETPPTPDVAAANIKNKGAYHPDDLADMPPDGGVKAWTAAVCSMVYCFTSWGSVSSYSVFLNFYLTNNEFPGVSKNQYAMVAGITMCFLLFWGWFVSALLSIYHVKVIMVVGSLFQFAGMIMASFAVNYWQLILTEGLISGFGCGFLFFGSVALVPSWFLKRRTLASGLTFAGTGIGGCVFALCAESMIDRTGDQRWALRTIAIVCIAMNGVATTFVEIRKPQNAKKAVDGASKLQTFKNALLVPIKPHIWFQKTTLLLIGYFCISSLGYVIILYSLSNFAVSVGVSSRQASHCLAVLNACQFVGRVLIGLASDKVGRFNISMLISYTVMILTFVFWIPISSFGAIMAFSVIMGLIMGYQFVTITPIVADFNGNKNFAAAWTMISTVNSILGLVAELIALSLKKDHGSKPYLPAQIFTGVIFFVSALFLFPLREIKVKNIIKDWHNTLLEEMSIEQSDEANLEYQISTEKKKDFGDNEDGHSAQDNQQQEPVNVSTTNIGEQELREQQQEKLAEYEELLKPNLRNYIRRVVYPIVA